MEMAEKFYLPSCILETKNYKQLKKESRSNPLHQNELIICSYQFAARYYEAIMAESWDLAVIDESHRLRNVYKPDNKIARAIKTALLNTPKILLTATPLQNSLMELYGLVSMIDSYAFGDDKSFKTKYARISAEGAFDELKARLAPLCHRTLRRQVLEYIRYTNRIPLTEDFFPTADEVALYDMVTEYLQKESLYALPNSQRQLITLILRKLLASSTFAIAGALDSLANRLKKMLKESTLNDGLAELETDFEEFETEAEEWGDEEPKESLTLADKAAIQKEINELELFRDLAVNITENAKGTALLSALAQGFKKAAELGSAQKAIVFTESRKTQNYLINLLSANGYNDKIVLFNGTNSDPLSKSLYKSWAEKYKNSDRVTGSRTADMRAALVDWFRDEAQIMIATEAGAEGINLQFCSMVVNYDLPWNPQRIEQRIGRCHRYGQKHDVVVVNFLNRNNAADQRVYELLAEKFALFDGVFGASDEVLGSIESGVDFEKRIVRIYQECRSSEEIQASFDELQRELETEIDESMKLTRKKLLENFDEEVHEKLRVNLKESTEYLNRYENWLWELARYALHRHADFLPEGSAFHLKNNPYSNNAIPLGLYKMGRHVEEGHVFRIGHPLAQHILTDATSRKLPEAEIAFDYSGHPLKISILEPLVGISGYLSLSRLSVESFEEEDHLIFSAVTDTGTVLDDEQAQRLFSLPGQVGSGFKLSQTISDQLQQIFVSGQSRIIEGISARNSVFFDDEMDKLEKWADDLKSGLEYELKELDREIKYLKTESKKILKLDEKLKAQKDIKELEKKRNTKRRTLFEAQDEIDSRKEGLIEGVEARLRQQISESHLFSIKWKII